MNKQKLLAEKKQEFKKIFQKSHIDYGLPFVDIIKYEVVFAKTADILAIYKKKRLRENHKVIIAGITFVIFILTYYIFYKLGIDDRTITYIIPIVGCIGCLIVNYKANHPKLNSNDFIVLFSEKNYNYLDFPKF